MENNRILVIDDEEALCEILKFNLERDGYEVDTAFSGEQALTYDLRKYSLIILDVMMGELSGFSLLKILKQRDDTRSIPVILCTAKDSEEDTVNGLDLGADDYISKPFSLKEVSARVRTVLRRYGAGAKSEVKEEGMISDGIRLDEASKRCYVDDADISLTKTEFEILKMLSSRPGVVFSRDEILSKVWGDSVIVLDRTIDVNITRLRKKLGKYGYKLVTRSGYGYTFEP